MKKVEAELREMFKITVGDNGVCMGCYDPSNEWHESYYDEDLKNMAEILSVIYPKGLPKEFIFEKMEVLVYDGMKFDYKELGYYQRYSSEDTILKKEYGEFIEYWNELSEQRKKMIEIEKKKEEEREKLKKIQYQHEKEQKDYANYLALKKQFENK